MIICLLYSLSGFKIREVLAGLILELLRCVGLLARRTLVVLTGTQSVRADLGD